MRYNFVGAIIVSDEKCIAVDIIIVSDEKCIAVDVRCSDIEKSD
jgi:hypothetical protein